MSGSPAAGELARAARQITAEALAAVDPSRLVAAELGRRAGSGFGGAFALGKAAAALARGADAFLSPGSSRLVVRPHSAPALGDPDWQEMSGGHPLPDEASVSAGERLAAWLEGLRGPAGAPLLALISGGGSACLELPAVGLELADLIATQRALLGGGVPIALVNSVRCHLSRMKGGGALRLFPGPVLALVLSDVPGDDPAVVASGPFAADRTTFGEARAAVAALGDPVPAAVQSHLASGTAGEVLETVKPGDPALARLELVRIGGIGSAMAAAAAAARQLGFAVATGALAGEAAEAGRRLVARGRGLPAGEAGACLVLGGETVVRVGAAAGLGGRNQELALAAAGALALDGGDEVVLALATDGEDGATGAAGAVVDGGAWAELGRLGVDPTRALAEHDSHPALAALPGALVTTGPTGTNVADLVLYLRGRRGGPGGKERLG